MRKNIYSIDLSINFEIDEHIVQYIYKYLHIQKIGINCLKSTGSRHNSIILKVKNSSYMVRNQIAQLPYLINSGSDLNSQEKFSACDVVLVTNPAESKTLLQKSSGKNLGFEIYISKLKYMNANEVGKWFSDVKYFYDLCKKYDHQLILSSGAKDIFELSSLGLFNSVLYNLDISSTKYWSEYNNWLRERIRGNTIDIS